MGHVGFSSFQPLDLFPVKKEKENQNQFVIGIWLNFGGLVIFNVDE